MFILLLSLDFQGKNAKICLMISSKNMDKNRVELGYNVMKGTEYFVSL
jgi:hypothetical protein